MGCVSKCSNHSTGLGGKAEGSAQRSRDLLPLSPISRRGEAAMPRKSPRKKMAKFSPKSQNSNLQLLAFDSARRQARK